MDIKGFFNDKRKVVKLMWVAVMTPVAILFLMLFLAAAGVFGRMPSFEELENPKSNLATEIYGDNGHVIGTFFVQNRSYVQYEELFPQDSTKHISLDGHVVPPVVAALIATEDERFRSHSGIDIPSGIRQRFPPRFTTLPSGILDRLSRKKLFTASSSALAGATALSLKRIRGLSASPRLIRATN